MTFRAQRTANVLAGDFVCMVELKVGLKGMWVAEGTYAGKRIVAEGFAPSDALTNWRTKAAGRL